MSARIAGGSVFQRTFRRSQRPLGFCTLRLRQCATAAGVVLLMARTMRRRTGRARAHYFVTRLLGAISDVTMPAIAEVVTAQNLDDLLANLTGNRDGPSS
jgi:hypothetical protein